MAVDPTTLNQAEQVDQHTAFVLAPACVRCGYGSLSLRRDGRYRCDGCTRIVTSVEHAPSVYSRPPNLTIRAGVPA